MPLRIDVVLFDLLTALLDSWTLWDAAAGGREDGRRWRMRYLELTYGAHGYAPYEALVRRSALDAGLEDAVADTLVRRWDELTPWPEVHEALHDLRQDGYRLGVVTNCSELLGHRAVAQLGIPVHLVTAERAGAYKPDAAPYLLALEEMHTTPERTLFVAGSPADIGGATAVGMPVVWHNRIGLAAPREPVTRIESLRELVIRLRTGY
ncbi:MAG: HAD-IA family hydrolase [Gemmatimonadetes bacterium]|nr:HAD-IA family hydrolase [Gemmatimonadota bacterium]